MYPLPGVMVIFRVFVPCPPPLQSYRVCEKYGPAVYVSDP